MKIEERLKFLADSNSNYSLLWAQWEFDKKLLARALNTVSRDFPHYSLHDASHSSTIITQIEKVIAPNIEKLSATDCWLLLESCYWHDAGMIISNDEKKKLLESEDFRGHLDELAQGSHELASHAKAILQGKEQNDIKKALQISNSLTFVIADYFRVLHADRSGWNVSDPTRIKVNSPRTSLIPQRLFNFVAQIVQCHGKKREEILNIAKYNDGMDANDYAHPRYIAALLRIGDLLDIDDGRFCPTLLANIGEVPQSSSDHQYKHTSIKHLFINSDIIEIKAECEEYGGYHAQQAWFGYIQDEFDYQKRVWNEIVPDNSYRALPTLGNISCTINGFIALDGKVPNISLHSGRVYDYITGAQIYSEKYPFVRELIQNSIDATYYYTWDDLLYKQVLSSKDEDIQREKFNAALKMCEIKIDLKELNINEELINYKFKVRDSGLGMSLPEIRKLLYVGSETLPERKNLLKKMPDWAKPSGYFGIGLQTVFKLCERVVIKTKKTDNPCYELEVVNKKDSSYIISLKKINDQRFVGTEVTAYFSAPTIPEVVHMEGFDVLDSFDPLTDKKMPVVPSYIRSNVEKNFEYCPIKIYFNGQLKSKETLENKRKLLTDFTNGVDYDLYIQEDLKSNIHYLYKGVEFETKARLHGLCGTVNIFHENAGYWLTIDRKKGRTDKSREINELINSIFERNYDAIRHNSPNEFAADFFIYATLTKTNANKWHNYEIAGHKVIDYLNGLHPLLINTHSIYNDENNEKLNSTSPVFNFLGKIIISANISFTARHKETFEYKKYGRSYKVNMHALDFVSDNLGMVDIGLDIINQYLSKESYNKDTKRRTVLPCYNKKFELISLALEKLPNWVSYITPYRDYAKQFLFLPYDLDNIDNDMNIILQYYIRNNSLNVSEIEFKNKYISLWKELGLID